MANVLEIFGTSNQTITCTINSLANAGARASTVVDNSSNLYLDALVFITIVSASSSTSTSGYVTILAYATADGGSNYTEAATGSDAGITLTNPPNARVIGSLNVVANSTTYKAGPFSVAAAFGGILPQKWGIIVLNNSGATLSSSGNSAIYQGVYQQVA